jgi:hypothetical protein
MSFPPMMGSRAADRPRFPWLLLMAALVFAIGWTAVALRRTNLEQQGIDIVNHALMVRQLAIPGGDSEYWLGEYATYPHTAHYLAAVFLPLFDGNPIQALRCAALFVLLVMLIAQYGLLRLLLPWAPAVLVLVLWQAACALVNVADVNHFLWQGQYNYSRAVGAAALWLLLLLLARPPLGGWLHLCSPLPVVLLAAFALACHIAPGAIAFGTLGVFYLLTAWSDSGRRGESLIGLLLTLLAGAGMMFGTRLWQYMVANSGSDGYLPVPIAPLVALAAPTWVGAAVLLWRGRRARSRSSPVVQCVACALLVAGPLQAYLLYKWHFLKTTAPYAVRSVLFYTFALTSLLWISGAVNWLRYRISSVEALWSSRRTRWAATCMAGTALIVGLWVALYKDPVRRYYGIDRDPVQVARDLAEHHEELAGCYYYDPRQVFGSYYATAAGSGMPHSVTLSCLKGLYYEKNWQRLLAEEQVTALLLPAAVDPQDVFGSTVHAQAVGPYWRCDLEPFRTLSATTAKQ